MKKIMFNDRYGLTQAVMEGRKTMTRRIVSVPETWHGIDVCAIGPDTDKRSLLLYDADEFLIEDRNTGLCGQVMPRYKIGEEVAVAQPYRDCVNDILVNWGHKTDIAVMAFKELPGWTNKMFVRADLMPHPIRITDIRIEHLQDISDEDCLKEGLLRSDDKPYLYGFRNGKHNETRLSPKEAFAILIDRVSGKETWKNNPFVFVYEFELIK